MTAGSPLRFLYSAIYRLHVWYAVRTLQRFPGTRSVYASRGIASGEIVHGVSDIDIVTIGDWTPEVQRQLIAELRRLNRLSPLYDSTLWQQAHTLTALREMWASDYFFQSRFNEGRTQWKLLAGEDTISSLPAVPPERLPGGYMMELRNWWLHFIMSAFGTGPTARDLIFRNSVSYKAVAGILNTTAAIRGETPAPSRAETVARAAREERQHAPVLERLARSAKARHLRYEGDIQNDSLQVLLPVMEAAQSQVAGVLQAQPASGGLHIDGSWVDVLRSAPAEAHARRIVTHAREQWPGYRSASLLPSVACFALDDLLLMLEVDPTQLPSHAQLQEICRIHREGCTEVKQRITLYLLLRNGAYQLDLGSTIEMWRVVLNPAANPDVFSLLSRPEFVIDGKMQRPAETPLWTVFANDLATAELDVRRLAMGAADPAMLPNSLEISRNIWRHLQLEIVTRSTQAGFTLVPLTPAAIQKALAGWGIPVSPLFDQLQGAYRSELEGQSADVRPLLPPLMAMLNQLQ